MHQVLRQFFLISLLTIGFTAILSTFTYATNDWKTLSIPGETITSIDALAVNGSSLYLIVNKNQLYRYNTGVFTKISQTKYSYGDICVRADKVFANGGYFDLITNNWQSLTLPTEMNPLKANFKVNGCSNQIITITDDINPDIITYDPVSARFVDTRFPFTSLDGKPNTEIIGRSDGTLLYKSNYS